MVVWQGVFLATSGVPDSGMILHMDPLPRAPKPSQQHLPEAGVAGWFGVVLEVINTWQSHKVQQTSGAGLALE